MCVRLQVIEVFFLGLSFMFSYLRMYSLGSHSVVFTFLSMTL